MNAPLEKQLKRKTMKLDPTIHKALKSKANEYNIGMSDLIARYLDSSTIEKLVDDYLDAVIQNIKDPSNYDTFYNVSDKRQKLSTYFSDDLGVETLLAEYKSLLIPNSRSTSEKKIQELSLERAERYSPMVRLLSRIK